jgi:2-keto-4-pentenoate hydratase/2-oxohepta-3-ene-1,7-dioic acid hydratase in catechol pathway
MELNALHMKIAYVQLENGERSVVFIDNNGYYKIDNEGLSCVISDPINFIKAFDIIKNAGRKKVSVRRFLPPVKPNKIFLPAVNFRSHSQEASTPPPPEPYFFMKPSSVVIGHEDNIIIPKGLEKVDYEGEVAVVIGKKCKYVKEEEVWDYIFGFTIANDVSFRDYQFPERHPYGLNWVMGKSLDSGLPLGPWIVTKDEFKKKFDIITKLNGEIVQEGSSDDMIFSIEKLISYLSKGITLEPGDVITTGTPAGVAEFGNKRYLKEGDVIEVEVSGIGTLRNYVKKE